MAKSQRKSKREIRKPKAEKVKTNVSNPSQKAGFMTKLDILKPGRGK